MPSGERIEQDQAGQLVVTTPLVEELRSLRNEVTGGFAALKSSMATKADKADLSRIEARLEEHHRRITEVEAWKHDREVANGVHRERDGDLLTHRQKLWGGVAAAALFAATILGPVLANLVH